VLAQFGAEVPRLRIRNHLARIVVRAKDPLDEAIEIERFGPTDFNCAIQGAPVAILATARATSSAAIGWMCTGGRRTALP
jgi:hypothetical protein